MAAFCGGRFFTLVMCLTIILPTTPGFFDGDDVNLGLFCKIFGRLIFKKGFLLGRSLFIPTGKQNFATRFCMSQTVDVDTCVACTLVVPASPDNCGAVNPLTCIFVGGLACVFVG